MTQALTQQEFIDRVKLIHGDKYNYGDVKYKDYKTNVIIICPIHGKFEQRPTNHLGGHGCKKCSFDRSKKRLTIEKFIDKANKIHNGKYTYEKFVYNNSATKGIITCPEHGDFLQTPNVHFSGCGCPKCKRSKGEETISNYLESQGYSFIPQKRFDDCRGKEKQKLPFDFYLPDYNITIEYQGEGHYKAIPYWKGVVGYERQKQCDLIKKSYCQSHNISLIEIPYFTKDIVGTLESQLSFLTNSNILIQ